MDIVRRKLTMVTIGTYRVKFSFPLGNSPRSLSESQLALASFHYE